MYQIIESCAPFGPKKITPVGDDEERARRLYAQKVESMLMAPLSDYWYVQPEDRRKMFSKAATKKWSYKEGRLEDHKLVYESTSLYSKHLDLGKNLKLVWDLEYAPTIERVA